MAKIRPYAEMYKNRDEDGWHEWDDIRYECPSCHKIIEEGDIGCTDCEVFFDWSKKAKIQTVKKIVWE
jgi:hypothetical protein